MLSNLPAAEALTARKPTPASHTHDAKVQTPGQSFFDVFTSDSGDQSNEKSEHIADSAPTGSEASEISDAGVQKPEAPKSASTIDASTFSRSLSSEMQVPRNQDPEEAESPLRELASRGAEDVPGSAGARDSERNSNSDVSQSMVAPQKSARELGHPAALSPAALLSEQAIRTHMTETQPRAQQIQDRLPPDQASAKSPPMHMEANRSNPQIAVGNRNAKPLIQSHESDTTKPPVFKNSALDQPNPAGSSTASPSSSIAEPHAHSGGNQHRPYATEAPDTSEKTARSAQEQVFLSTNRYGGDINAPEGTKHVIAGADAAKQLNHPPVSAPPAAPQSGSVTRNLQDAPAVAQRTAKPQAAQKSGVLPAAAHPTAVLRSIASESEIASTQAGQTTRPVHTPDIALQPQNILGDQKPPPVQIIGMQGAINTATKMDAPLTIGVTVAPADTTPSDENIRPPAAGSQTTSPQARASIPGEFFENQTRTQNLPIKPAKDILTSAPLASAMADVESETPRSTASSTIWASQGTTNATASPANQTAKTASVPPIASLSSGVQASLVQHDPEVAIDEPMLETTRLTEQLSGVLAVSESPTASITRPETIRSIAAQMATVVPRGTQAPVEIALNPEELGQVKMSVTTTESSVVMTIAAERPETLDLMRRNLEQLTSEFRELGYSDINFVFAGDGSGTSGDSDGSRENQSGSSAEQEQVAQNETLAPSAASSGVDVRV